MVKHRIVSLYLLWLPAFIYSEESYAEEPTVENADVSEQAIIAGNQTVEKQIRYVNDNLVIMMRSGNSNKHKIIKHIPAGTKLQLLATEDKYSRVVTSRGTEGWVLNQFLTDKPIAKHLLPQAKQQLSRLKTQNKQLQKELLESTKQNEQLTASTGKMADELQNFRTVAAKPIQLQKQNTTLNEEKVSLENKNEMMAQEIQVLRDHSDKQWFLAGAGVMLFGIFLGLVIPRLRKRRKSDWSSL
jgi:SH3 domain protein